MATLGRNYFAHIVTSMLGESKENKDPRQPLYPHAPS
jgi:hypothetical protein